MNTSDNPWYVSSIQDFYYLKCPECTFDTKKEIVFQEHALQSHPLSVVFFESQFKSYSVTFIGLKETRSTIRIIFGYWKHSE